MSSSLLRSYPHWAQTTLGVHAVPNRTAVCGFSHGGAFALTMASRHDDLFGLAIAFSTAGAFAESQRFAPLHRAVPRFYLSAGTKEKPLLKAMRRYGKKTPRPERGLYCCGTTRWS